jgi:dinuclear metal center YbgI/SA1388 family protein
VKIFFYFIMTKINEITAYLENWAPIAYQEDYDNAGLIIGDKNWEVKSVLVTLDVTEAVILEAINKGANLVMAHHPIVFKGLKKINGNNYVEKAVLLAIKNDIAIYASHTNLDHIVGGVNWKIGEKLGLQDIKILSPKSNTLLKLVVFVPTQSCEKVLDALYAAGAGNIGNYENCSFLSEGLGNFTPKIGSKPNIGQLNVPEKVNETKIEVLVPNHVQKFVLEALFKAHPYEEVAYYLTKIENLNKNVGSGAIGELPNEMNEAEFLQHLKVSMGLKVLKYTPIGNKMIKKVALCGGAGSFLLQNALQNQADAFVTSDYKYHEFFDAEGKILIADIGHYESEVYTKELIQFYLSKKFSNFATLLSETDTNPVKYYI